LQKLLTLTTVESLKNHSMLDIIYIFQLHTKPENMENVELNKIPPFRTSFGSIATTDNAIRLVYRYFFQMAYLCLVEK
jgi:hypothetical protein